MTDPRLIAVVQEVMAEMRGYEFLGDAWLTLHVNVLKRWADRLESALSVPPPEEATEPCQFNPRGSWCLTHDCYPRTTCRPAPEATRPEGWQPKEER